MATCAWNARTKAIATAMVMNQSTIVRHGCGIRLWARSKTFMATDALCAPQPLCDTAHSAAVDWDAGGSHGDLTMALLRGSSLLFEPIASIIGSTQSFAEPVD